MATWLLTGGAGYIGSHVLMALRAAGREVVVLDDLSTGLRHRVPADVDLVQASVSDVPTLVEVLRRHDVQGVVHLAAKKAVEESCADPLLYYRENVGGVLALLAAMRTAGVRRLVYSSSAAVYGTPEGDDAVDETSRTRPESPYGQTKLIGEQMVADCAGAYGMSTVCLRYFNVVGVGDPALAEIGGSNLFPTIVQRLAAGLPVQVFGGEHPTPDGTCVRDYIHVCDLAQAHIAAADLTGRLAGNEIVNVGSGRGYSVLEVVEQFGRGRGSEVPHVITAPRAGDPASMVARIDKAARVLGWAPSHGLPEMVADTLAAASGPGG